MYFSEIESYFKQAKLEFVCSGNYLDDYSEVLFDEEQTKLMNATADPSLKQTTKDFFQ